MLSQNNSKYYAVAEGKETGIFYNWNKVKSLVDGYKGAKYKSFKTLKEAQEYLSITPPDKTPNPLYSPVNNVRNTRIKSNENDEIIIYTDGSCSNKLGGYGYVIISNDFVVPICGKVPHYPCTNQIAELYAIYQVIVNLTNNYSDDIVKNGIIIYTDSQYSIGCLTTWYYNWQKNGWVTSKKEPVKNSFLIKNILKLSVGLNIKYKHVKAHNGDTCNEWADRLANNGRKLN